MSDLTLPQRIAIAGGIARVIANHGSDVGALLTDARKAMNIAAEIHGVIDRASAPVPPAQNPEAPWVNPEAPHPAYKTARPPRPSAASAAAHVEQNGLSPAEQAIFDRASQSSG